MAKTKKTVGSVLKAAGVKKQEQRSEPLWKGPTDDGPLGGITQSALSLFCVCRERFRLVMMEGLKEHDTFSHRLEFGQMWHTCEEYQSQGQAWEGALQSYCKDLCKQYPLQQEQIVHWKNICQLQFPVYVDFWEKHPDEKQRRPLLQEQVFDVPYSLPSGRVVRLRGKWDGVDLIGRGKAAGVYLKENKTKGDINEEQLKKQLQFDLQTMFYFVALAADCNDPKYVSERLAGVRYNVVRRPLAGGRNSIRQKKTETITEFYDRLAVLIRGEPEFFFMRWRVEVTVEDRQRFCREFLDPILEQLCDWYEFILTSPTDSWYTADARGCPAHWRTPYGLWNPMADGGSTEWDEYLATGSTLGLRRVDSLFGELA